MKFKDLPLGTVFQVLSGQGCTAFGQWVKAKATDISNAHRLGNENHRIFIGRDLKVKVLEGANAER